MCDWKPWVLKQTHAAEILDSQLIQTLWSGYGELRRLTLLGGPIPSVILKRIVPPAAERDSLSDRRKRRSYEVEAVWYREVSRSCDDKCRVARCFGVQEFGATQWLLLEDLDVAGYSPCRCPGVDHTRSGLAWLAHFHSRFLGIPCVDLWGTGCYWHLETRREEWERLPCGPLKERASEWDSILSRCRFQSLVHGDAKTPNFCWTSDGKTAAAVDFQYVGSGPGIRDVALFLDRCLGQEISDSLVDHWLDIYFGILSQAMRDDGHQVSGGELEDSWRPLYAIAWADYCRFRQGWGSPSVLSAYSESQIERALTISTQ